MSKTIGSPLIAVTLPLAHGKYPILMLMGPVSCFTRKLWLTAPTCLSHKLHALTRPLNRLQVGNLSMKGTLHILV